MVYNLYFFKKYTSMGTIADPNVTLAYDYCVADDTTLPHTPTYTST